MIIRIGKLECVTAAAFILIISFVCALSSERNATLVSAKPTSVKLPIIMYHHITESANKAGKYTVLCSEFESDLNEIRRLGYTTVTVDDIISYVNGEENLPEKPIMITFDDGFESFYTLAYPLLKKHSMKAVLSVIGSVTEKYSAINDHNINYSNLTWNEIGEMHKSGTVEIQNHSYDMHKSDSSSPRKGISKMKNESANEYKTAVTDDLKKLQSLLLSNCGIVPSSVAYPFGAYSKETKQIIKDCGFSCSFVCEERINTITVNDKDSLYNLGRYNRASGISSDEFFNKLI